MADARAIISLEKEDDATAAADVGGELSMGIKGSLATHGDKLLKFAAAERVGDNMESSSQLAAQLREVRSTQALGALTAEYDFEAEEDKDLTFKAG